MELSPQAIAHGLTSYVVLLFSLSFHESAHAWAALRMGDDTASREGRISLNPLVHIDPVGTVLLPLIMFVSSGSPIFGWAKPTPYNPANFRRDRSMATGHVMVAGAGPISNLVLSVLFAVAFFFVWNVAAIHAPTHPAVQIAFAGVQINVLLAVFNLVPLPPLDGSKVAAWGLPRSLADAYVRVIEPYGGWILLILFATGILNVLVGPLTFFLTQLLLAVSR